MQLFISSTILISIIKYITCQIYQSVFSIIYIFGDKSQAPPGFEPGAAALQVQRSTTEL